jgi:hypothetical protein
MGAFKNDKDCPMPAVNRDGAFDAVLFYQKPGSKTLPFQGGLPSSVRMNSRITSVLVRFAFSA